MSSVRRPTGTAFAIRDPLPWDDLSGVVRAAEAAGYSALFLPEVLGRDAFVTLGALAGETRDLLLGTGVLPMRSRTPLLTAMGAATVHERSGGRLVLGVGTGAVERRALDELRQTVLDLRALLDERTVERGGEQVSLALPPGSPVPIWLSAIGPRAMRLAGEVADGVILNWCPPERVAFARERLSEGAEAAGRDPSEVVLAVYVRSWVGDDIEAATTALKDAAGEYAGYPAYARQFEQLGLGEAAARAVEARAAGRPQDAPEVLVRSLAAVGDEARERLSDFRAAGADLVVVYPVPSGEPVSSIERTLLALAPP